MVEINENWTGRLLTALVVAVAVIAAGGLIGGGIRGFRAADRCVSGRNLRLCRAHGGLRSTHLGVIVILALQPRDDLPFIHVTAFLDVQLCQTPLNFRGHDSFAAGDEITGRGQQRAAGRRSPGPLDARSGGIHFCRRQCRWSPPENGGGRGDECKTRCAHGDNSAGSAECCAASRS